MIAWSKNKKIRFIIRVISIIIIQAFLLYDITWATGGEIGAHKLSPPSIFQQPFPNEKSSEFKSSILSDIKFLTAAFSIGTCLLIDKLPIRYVKPVIKKEFSKKAEFLKGLDLDSIDYKDGVASVKYSKDSKIYTIRVCAREKLNDLAIKNSHWAVSNKFCIQVVEAGAASSDETQKPATDREKISGEIDILLQVIEKADADIAQLEGEKTKINARLISLKEESDRAEREAEKTRSMAAHKERKAEYDRIKVELADLTKQKTELDARLKDLGGKRASILDRIDVLKKDIEAVDAKIKALQIKPVHPTFLEQKRKPRISAFQLVIAFIRGSFTSAFSGLRQNLGKTFVTAAFACVVLFSNIQPAFAHYFMPGPQENPQAVVQVWNKNTPVMDTLGGIGKDILIAEGKNVTSQTLYGKRGIVEQLAQANKISNPNLIHPGQKIEVPSLSIQAQEKLISGRIPFTIPSPDIQKPPVTKPPEVKPPQVISQPPRVEEKVEPQRLGQQIKQAEQKLVELQNELTQLEEKNKQLQKDQKISQAEIEKAYQEKAKVELQLKDLNNKIAKAKQVLEESHKIPSKSFVQEIKNAWGSLGLGWQIAIVFGIGIIFLIPFLLIRARKRLEQAKGEIRQEEERLKKLEVQRQEAEQKLAEEEKKISEAQKKIEEMQKKEEDIARREQITGLKAQYFDLLTQLSQIQSAEDEPLLNEIVGKLEQLTTPKELESELAELEHLIQAALTQVRNRIQQAKDAQAELEKRRKIIEGLEAEVAELKEQIKEAVPTAEVKSLQQRVDALTKEIEDLKQSIKKGVPEQASRREKAEELITKTQNLIDQTIPQLNTAINTVVASIGEVRRALDIPETIEDIEVLAKLKVNLDEEIEKTNQTKSNITELENELQDNVSKLNSIIAQIDELIVDSIKNLPALQQQGEEILRSAGDADALVKKAADYQKSISEHQRKLTEISGQADERKAKLAAYKDILINRIPGLSQAKSIEEFDRLRQNIFDAYITPAQLPQDLLNRLNQAIDQCRGQTITIELQIKARDFKEHIRQRLIPLAREVENVEQLDEKSREILADIERQIPSGAERDTFIQEIRTELAAIRKLTEDRIKLQAEETLRQAKIEQAKNSYNALTSKIRQCEIVILDEKATKIRELVDMLNNLDAQHEEIANEITEERNAAHSLLNSLIDNFKKSLDTRITNDILLDVSLEELQRRATEMSAIIEKLPIEDEEKSGYRQKLSERFELIKQQQIEKTITRKRDSEYMVQQLMDNISDEDKNIWTVLNGIYPFRDSNSKEEIKKTLINLAKESEDLGKLIKALYDNIAQGGRLKEKDMVLREQYEQFKIRAKLRMDFDKTPLKIEDGLHFVNNGREFRLVLAPRDILDLIGGYISVDCTNPGIDNGAPFLKYALNHIRSPGFLKFRLYRQASESEWEWAGNIYAAVAKNKHDQPILLIDALQIPSKDAGPFETEPKVSRKSLPFEDILQTATIAEQAIEALVKYAQDFGFNNVWLGFVSNFYEPGNRGLVGYFQTKYADAFNITLAPILEETRSDKVKATDISSYGSKLSELGIESVGVSRHKLDSFNYRRGFAKVWVKPEVPPAETGAMAEVKEERPGLVITKDNLRSLIEEAVKALGLDDPNVHFYNKEEMQKVLEMWRGLERVDDTILKELIELYINGIGKEVIKNILELEDIKPAALRYLEDIYSNPYYHVEYVDSYGKTIKRKTPYSNDILGSIAWLLCILGSPTGVKPVLSSLILSIKISTSAMYDRDPSHWQHVFESKMETLQEILPHIVKKIGKPALTGMKEIFDEYTKDKEVRQKLLEGYGYSKACILLAGALMQLGDKEGFLFLKDALYSKDKKVQNWAGQVFYSPPLELLPDLLELDKNYHETNVVRISYVHALKTALNDEKLYNAVLDVLDRHLGYKKIHWSGMQIRKKYLEKAYIQGNETQRAVIKQINFLTRLNLKLVNKKEESSAKQSRFNRWFGGTNKMFIIGLLMASSWLGFTNSTLAQEQVPEEHIVQTQPTQPEKKIELPSAPEKKALEKTLEEKQKEVKEKIKQEKDEAERQAQLEAEREDRERKEAKAAEEARARKEKLENLKDGARSVLRWIGIGLLCILGVGLIVAVVKILERTGKNIKPIAKGAATATVYTAKGTGFLLKHLFLSPYYIAKFGIYYPLKGLYMGAAFTIKEIEKRNVATEVISLILFLSALTGYIIYKITAYNALINMLSPSTGDLIRMLEDPYRAIMWAVFGAAGVLTSTSLVRYVSRNKKNMPVSGVALSLIIVFSSIAGTANYYIASHSPKERARVEAIEVLSRSYDLASPEVVDSLIEALNDRSADVRRHAAEALGGCGDKKAVEPLIRALDDPETSFYAAFALVKLNVVKMTDDIELLKKILKADTSYNLGSEVTAVFVHMGARAIPNLIDMLSDDNSAFQRAASDALASIAKENTHSVLDGLERTLSDEKADVRLRALKIIIGMDNKQDTVSVLTRISQQDRDWAMREKAISRLQEIKSDAKEAEVMKLISEKDEKGLIRTGAPAVGFLVSALESGPRGYGEDGQANLSVKVLGKIGGRSAVEPIIKAMQDGKVDSNVAVEALGQLKDARAIEPLLKLKKNSYYSSRSEPECDKIAEAIIQINGGNPTEALIKALGDDNEYTRRIAAKVLEKSSDPKIIKPFIERLKDDNDEVMVTATRVLGRLASKDAVDPLAVILKDENVKEERVKAAAEALVQIGRPAVKHLLKIADDKTVGQRARDIITKIGRGSVDSLVEQLKHWNPLKRKQAIELLIKIGKPAIPSLVQAFGSDAYSVREGALNALIQIGDTETSVGLLINGLRNQNLNIRWRSAVALMEMPDQKAVKPLTQCLNDSSHKVRKAVAQALGFYSGLEAVHALIRLLHDEDVFVRKAAVVSLGRIGFGSQLRNEVTSEIIQRLDDTDWQVRAAAARVITSSPGGIALISHLEDPDPYVRRQVVLSLGKVSSSTAYFNKALDDSDEYVRLAAVQAIEQINPSSINSSSNFALRPLFDDDENARKAAQKALKEKKDFQVAYKLLEILADANKSNNERAYALEALKTLDELGAKVLIVGLESRDEAVRQVSAQALAKMGKTACSQLVENLRNEDITTRQAIVNILIGIGDPAKKDLYKAIWAEDDPELSGLAKAVLWKIDYMAAQRAHQNLYFRYITWPGIKSVCKVTLPIYFAIIIGLGSFIGFLKFLKEKRGKPKKKSSILRNVSKDEKPILIAEAIIRDKTQVAISVKRSYQDEVTVREKQLLEKVLSELDALGSGQMIQRVSKIKIVKGNDRLMHIDKDTYELVIDIDAFKSYYLLLMETEHELQHILVKSLGKRAPPPLDEELAILRHEVMRFLSFSPSQQEDVFRVLRTDNDLDDKEFYKVLEYAQEHGLDNVADMLIDYIKQVYPRAVLEGLAGQILGTLKQNMLFIWENLRSQRLVGYLQKKYTIEPRIARLMVIFHRKMIHEIRRHRIGEDYTHAYQFTLRELYKWAEFFLYYKNNWGNTKSFIKGAFYVYGDRMQNQNDEDRFFKNLRDLDLDLLAVMDYNNNIKVDLDALLNKNRIFAQNITGNDEQLRIGDTVININQNPDVQYVPSKESAELVFINRTLGELERLAQAVELNDPVLLVGQTGVGKTALIRNLAYMTKNAFRRFNLNGQTDKLEFIGGFKPVSDTATDKKFSSAKNAFRFNWQNGILIQAMEKGHWIVLDEINLGEPEVIERIRYLLEPKGYLRVTEHKGEQWIQSKDYDQMVADYVGKHSGSQDQLVKEAIQDLSHKGIFRIHPNFRLFATMNPPEYEGRKQLSPALMNKFRMKWVNKLTKDDICEILKNKYKFNKETVERLVVFYDGLIKISGRQENPEKQFSQTQYFTIRQFFRFATRLQQWIDNQKQALPQDKITARLSLEAQEVYLDPLRAEHDRKIFYVLLKDTFNAVPKESTNEIKIDTATGKASFYDVTLPINKKNSLLVPSKSAELEPTSTTRDYLRKIARSIEMNERTLLVGPTGSGKTAFIRNIAYLTNNGYKRVNLDGQADIGDLIGKYVPEEGTVGGFRWEDGDLVKAMKEGSWILLDEFNLADPEILERINSLLDDDGYLIITEHNSEKVIPHPNFRLFAAMNPERYAGRAKLSEALRNKFTEKWISTDFGLEELKRIAKFNLTSTNISRTQPIDADSADAISEAMALVHQDVLGMINAGRLSRLSLSSADGGEYQFSLRELKDWAEFIRNLTSHISEIAINNVIETIQAEIGQLEAEFKKTKDTQEKEEIQKNLNKAKSALEAVQQDKLDPKRLWKWGVNRALIEGAIYIYCDRLQGGGDKSLFYDDVLNKVFTEEKQKILGSEIVDIQKLKALEKESRGANELIEQQHQAKIDLELLELIDKFNGLTAGFPLQLRPSLKTIESYLANEEKRADGVRGFALLPKEIAITLIEMALTCSNPKIKCAAMEALMQTLNSRDVGFIEDFTPFAATLEQLLGSDNQDVRLTAALVLEHMGWTQWTKIAIPRIFKRPDKLPFKGTLNKLIKGESNKGDYLGLLKFLKNPMTLSPIALINIAIMLFGTPFILGAYGYSAWFLSFGYIGTFSVGTVSTVLGLANIFNGFYAIIYLPQYMVMASRYKKLPLDLNDYYVLLDPAKAKQFIYFPFKSEEKTKILTNPLSIVFLVSSILVGMVTVVLILHGARADSLPVVPTWFAWPPLLWSIGTLAGGGLSYFVAATLLLITTAVKEMVYKPLKGLIIERMHYSKWEGLKEILSAYDSQIITLFRRYSEQLKQRGVIKKQLDETIGGENPLDYLRGDKIKIENSGVMIDEIFMPFPTALSSQTNVFVPESENADLIPTVSTVKNLKKIAISVLLDDPILLIGETGVGKTSLVRHLAYLSKHNFRRFNLNGQTDKTEFIGGYKPDSKGMFKWRDGILVEAMIKGHWLVLDELNLAESQVLERLNSLLDDEHGLVLSEHLGEHFKTCDAYDEKKKGGAKEYFDAQKNANYLLDDAGTRIYCIHPDFRLFATMNPAEYAGRKILSPALMNRFRVKWIDDLTMVEKKLVLLQKFPQEGKPDIQGKHFVFGDDMLDYIDVFHDRVSEAARSRSIGREMSDPYYYSLRDMLRLMKRATGRYRFLEAKLNSETSVHQKEDILGQELIEVYADRIRDDADQESVTDQVSHFLGEFKQDDDFTVASKDDVILFGEVVVAKGPQGGPYIPGSDSKLEHLPSALRYLKRLAKAVSMNEKILLIGPTGSAKTALIRYLAYLTNHNFARMNLDAQSDTSELIGQYAPLENKAGEFKWNDGLLIKALKEGWWVLLDEINLADAEVLERVNSLLDDDACLVITEHEDEKIISAPEYEKKLQLYVKGFMDAGLPAEKAREKAIDELTKQKIFRINPNFRLFAAMNPEHYAGRSRLSMAMHNKFTEMWLSGKWEHSELVQLVQGYLTKYIPNAANSGISSNNMAEAMVTLHENIQALSQSGELIARNFKQYEFSIRELRAWARYIGKFAPLVGMENAFTKGAIYLYFDRLEPTKMEYEEPQKESDYDKFKKLLGQVPFANQSLLHTGGVSSKDIVVTKDYVEIRGVKLPRNKSSDIEFVPTKEIAWLVPTKGTIINLERVAQSALLREPLLLVGETGVGKTSLIRFLAYLTNNNFRRFNLSGQTEKLEFIGGFKPTEEGVFKWCNGILIEAMKKGHWLVLDEINLAPSQIIERLNSLLDDDGFLVLTEHENEKWIRAEEYDQLRKTNTKLIQHEPDSTEFLFVNNIKLYRIDPNFRLFATMNPAEAEYAGRKVFSPALMNRFRVKWINELSEGDLREIIFKSYDKTLPGWLLDIALKVQLTMQQEGKKLIDGKVYYTIRHLHRWLDRIKAYEATDSSELRRMAAIEAKEVYSSGLSDENQQKELKMHLYRLLIDQFGDNFQDTNVQITSADKELYFGDVVIKKNGRKSTYVPAHSLDCTPSTCGYLKKLAKAALRKEPTLLIGPTGGGKTALVRYLSDLLNIDFISLDLDGQSDVAELIGLFMPEEKTSQYKWHPGLLLQALEKGWWILIDELNLAEPEILERLNSLLDDDGILVITEHNNEVYLPASIYDKKLDALIEELKKRDNLDQEAVLKTAKQNLRAQGYYRIDPNFRLFAAMNPEHYAGRNRLSLAMLNKFSQLWIPEDQPETEQVSIVEHYFNIPRTEKIDSIMSQAITRQTAKLPPSTISLQRIINFQRGVSPAASDDETVTGRSYMSMIRPGSSNKKIIKMEKGAEKGGLDDLNWLEKAQRWQKLRKVNSVIRKIEITSKFYGGDFNVKFKAGPAWAITYDTDPPTIIFPQNELMEKSWRYNVASAMHEGGHRDITWIDPYFYQSEAVRFLFNAVEDPRVNNWATCKFKGTKPYFNELYKEAFPIDQKEPFDDSVVLPNIQYGLGLIHHWFYGEEHPAIKNPHVLNALKKTRNDAIEAYNMLPGTIRVTREPGDKLSISSAIYEKMEVNLPRIGQMLALSQPDISAVRRIDKDTFVLTTGRGHESVIHLPEGDSQHITINIRPSEREKLRAAQKSARIIKDRILPVYQDLVRESIEKARQGGSKSGTGSSSKTEEQARQEVEGKSKEGADALSRRIPVDKESEEVLSADKSLPRNESKKEEQAGKTSAGKDQKTLKDSSESETREDKNIQDTDLETRPKGDVFPKHRYLTLKEKAQLKEKMKELSKRNLTRYDQYYVQVAQLIEQLFGMLDNELHKDIKPKYKGDYITGPKLNLRKAMSMGETGDTDIWLRRTRPSKRSFKFSLVLDESGSMEGGKSDKSTNAMLGTILVQEVLSRLGIDFSLLGYSDDPTTHKRFDQRLDHMDKNLLLSEIIGAFDRGRGNNEVMVLRQAIEQIDNTVAETKTIIFFTDGQAATDCDANELRQLLKLAEKKHIYVVGIGIGRDAAFVSNWFKPAIYVENVKDLPKVLSKVLIDVIVHKKPGSEIKVNGTNSIEHLPFNANGFVIPELLAVSGVTLLILGMPFLLNHISEVLIGLGILGVLLVAFKYITNIFRTRTEPAGSNKSDERNMMFLEKNKMHMEKESKRLAKELQSIEKEISIVKKEKGSVEQKFASLNINLSEVKKKTREAKTSESRINEKARLDSIKEEIRNLESQNTETQEKLEALSAKQKTNEAKIAGLRKKIGHIEAQSQNIAMQGEWSPVNLHAIDEAKVYASSFVNSLVIRAREAKKLGQELIIGFDTSWIPGYEKDKLEHMALNPLIIELEKLEQRLSDLGLDNVIIVNKSGDDLAGELISNAEKTNTPLSNVIVLASQDTINSKAFDNLRSTKDEKKAFIAAINTDELDKYCREHSEDSDRMYIRIVEMLSIALELSLGKEPPNDPLIISYDQETRIVIFMPKPEPVDFKELKNRYDAERQTIISA